MWEYSEKVLDHFYNPRNYGELPNPTVVGEVGSIICGDALKLMLKIENGIIEDARFQTFGCGSAIASSSILTEMIKGKTIEEAEKITNKDIVKELGGLPQEKMHCSVMGMEALQAALKNYKAKEEPTLEVEKIICECFQVSERKIRDVIRENHLTTVEEITHYTKAGGGCGRCIPELEKILREEMAKRSPKDEKKMTTLQKILLIKDTIDREVRPALQRDGGDLELIEVDGNKVIVSLRGFCINCPSAKLTLKNFVEKKLHEFVSPYLEVIEERK